MQARLARLVYGCDDPKGGAVRSLYRVADDPRLNHRAEVVGGVLAAECAELVRSFFSEETPFPEPPARSRLAVRCESGLIGPPRKRLSW